MRGSDDKTRDTIDDTKQRVCKTGGMNVYDSLGILDIVHTHIHIYTHRPEGIALFARDYLRRGRFSRRALIAHTVINHETFECIQGARVFANRVTIPGL